MGIAEGRLLGMGHMVGEVVGKLALVGHRNTEGCADVDRYAARIVGVEGAGRHPFYTGREGSVGDTDCCAMFAGVSEAVVAVGKTQKAWPCR